MDFFLWNLIWVTWGNISISKGTPGFHCTYPLLLLNCKCFDLKGHGRGKACLLTKALGSISTWHDNTGQLLSWAISRPPATWEWAWWTQAYDWWCLFHLLVCCVIKRTRQETGHRFQHDRVRDRATANTPCAHLPGASTNFCIPILGFLWTGLLKSLWV